MICYNGWNWFRAEIRLKELLFPLVHSEVCSSSNAQEHVWLLTKQHPVQIHPPTYWSQILWLLLLWYVSSLLHPLQAAAGGLQLHISFFKDQNVHVADGVHNKNCVSNSANGCGLPFIHHKCLKPSSSTNHPFFSQHSGAVLSCVRSTSRDDETVLITVPNGFPISTPSSLLEVEWDSYEEKS